MTDQNPLDAGAAPIPIRVSDQVPPGEVWLVSLGGCDPVTGETAAPCVGRITGIGTGSRLVADLTVDRERPATPPLNLGAGGLQMSGTLGATFEGDAFDAFARTLGLPPAHLPLYDMRFEYGPDDPAVRRCPVCRGEVTALVAEGALLSASGPSPTPDGQNVEYRLAAHTVAAYRAQPCGHRFDRRGEQLADEGGAG